MRPNSIVRTAMLLGALAAGRPLAAQETAPPVTPTPEKEKPAYRPIESNVIINLPSVEVPREGTLTFLVTHRFQDRIQNGNIGNFFTLDSGNDWGFGLWYAPLKNLNIGFYRTSDLDVYEASAQYEFPHVGGFGASLRLGEDWRTQESVTTSPHSSFFAQAVLAYSLGPYARLTAVPTYLSATNGEKDPFIQPPLPPGDRSCTETSAPGFYNCSGAYGSLFNVPVGLSIALTHSITVHGEVIPRLSKVNSNGVGWSVTVEKSLLRHRFAFFAGNQRHTTVDQYTGSVPSTQPAGNVYIGFNLYRAWKLN